MTYEMLGLFLMFYGEFIILDTFSKRPYVFTQGDEKKIQCLTSGSPAVFNAYSKFVQIMQQEIRYRQIFQESIYSWRSCKKAVVVTQSSPGSLTDIVDDRYRVPCRRNFKFDDC